MEQNSDMQAALEALNDAEECFQPETMEELRKHFGTIRAALTAQQPDVNQELLKTLSFYSNIFNYKPSVYMDGETNIQIDGGDLARQALARAEKEGK